MMLPAEQTFTGHLYRPVLDLGPPVEGGPLYSWGVEFAVRSLTEERAYPWTYWECPPSFRERLLQLTGLPHYRVQDPRELTVDLRTPRWDRLCDALDRYNSLPLEGRCRVIRLLGKLGFCQAVLDRVPELSDREIGSAAPLAELAYLRALARFLIRADGGDGADGDGPFDLGEFERLAACAPRGGHVRILALNQIVVHHAKRTSDAEALEESLRRHRAEIEHARPTLDDAGYALLLSRHHRAAGFLPMLRGDRAGVVREMELCQEYAERLPRDTLQQRVAADELLFAALESRTKEALWLGDFDLAAFRARRLVAMYPSEPMARDHLGQVLVEQGRIQEALEVYMSVARLSAPEVETA